MEPVRVEEILDLEAYEKIRDAFRREVIRQKALRRVPVGDLITFVFENRDTVRFQIQEMLRAERITDPAKVAEEVAVYNTLLPGEGELSATLFIEVPDPARIRETLELLVGIDREGCVTLTVGPHRVPGVFEKGRSREDKVSAVHYVRFPFSPEARKAFLDEAQDAFLVVDHPHYRHRQWLGEATRRALIQDLAPGHSPVKTRG